MNQARAIRHETVPVVDLGPYFSAGDGVLDVIADEWLRYMRTGGYLCLVNHGFSTELLSAMQLQSIQFHELSVEEKLKVGINHHQRGFISSRVNNVDPLRSPNSTHPEALVLATEHTENHPGVLKGKQFYGRNQWPVQLPDFRAVASGYMQAMVELGKRLLPIWSAALDLEPGFFDRFFVNDYSYFRMVHYPPCPDDAVAPSPVHADAGFMTLSPQSNLPGLQILHPDGYWFWPRMPKTSITVFVGSYLELWSGGRFKAARHRVVADPELSRYSLPCFVNPGFESETCKLPNCPEPLNQSGTGPSTFWDFFSSYMFKAYRHFEDTSPTVQ